MARTEIVFWSYVNGEGAVYILEVKDSLTRGIYPYPGENHLSNARSEPAAAALAPTNCWCCLLSLYSSGVELHRLAACCWGCLCHFIVLVSSRSPTNSVD